MHDDDESDENDNNDNKDNNDNNDSSNNNNNNDNNDNDVISESDILDKRNKNFVRDLILSSQQLPVSTRRNDH